MCIEKKYFPYKRACLLMLLLVMMAVKALANEPIDTLQRIGYTIYGGPTWQLGMDRYERKWLRGKNGMVLGAEVNVPTWGRPDAEAIDRDYGFPTLSFGMKLSLNMGVTLRRTADSAWGKAEMVDYDSRLGNFLTLYGAFDRPIFRSGRWQLDYTLRTGISYGTRPYDKENNVDNELIGSRLNIYFGAGLTASYRFADEWSLMAGVLYGHHSNGALARPNKGENHVGPVIGIRHLPNPTAHPAKSLSFEENVGGFFANFRFGLGAKTLLEDWQTTQFRTDPTDPDYRTEHFRLYAAYSLSADVMYRYARRWASGIGCDLFYGTYYNDIPQQNTYTSPWSVGIAARHEAYYHRLSCDMALGFYLFRHMGDHAREVEKPYYERVGLSYSFPKWGLRVGFSIKAHLTKADLTEIVVGLPLRLSR